MFSNYYNPLEIEKLLNMARPSIEKVKEMINNNLSPLHIAKLLSVFNNAAARRIIIQKAHEQRKTVWDSTLFLVPPLYISNGAKEKGGCLDHCLYCPWHNGQLNKEKIIRLSPNEVQQEAKILLDMGYQDIELVAATDPLLYKSNQAKKYLEAIKNAGAKNIGINFFPLKDANSYSELAQAGCTFAIVWQETYQKDIYSQMHPRGPKSNMDYRLNAHDRALQGGIKTVGLAFLGGLANWQYETLATITHAQYLQKEYGANIIFGMPRWKKTKEINIKSCQYDDKMYEFVGALYSLALPNSLPWFSTRENFDLSAKSATGGGCISTLDCSTAVGGYTRQGIPQFPVFSYSYKTGVNKLEKMGFKIKTSLPFTN